MKKYLIYYWERVGLRRIEGETEKERFGLIENIARVRWFTK